MTGQEAQQAQTIAEIRARHTVPDIDHGRGGPVANPDCVALLEIVDSQAQKIAESKIHVTSLEAIIQLKDSRIAEQAKEIERLKEALESATEDGYDRFDGRNRTVKGKLVP